MRRDRRTNRRRRGRRSRMGTGRGGGKGRGRRRVNEEKVSDSLCLQPIGEGFRALLLQKT